MARQILETNNYNERLLKLVPAEWVSAFVGIKGILDSALAPSGAYFWVIAIQLLALPFYLIWGLKIKSRGQVCVTCISFAVWVFSLGGQHFGALSWYESYYGSIAIILWTSISPVWKFSNPSDSV